MARTAQLMAAAYSCAPKLSQMTRRARRKPYTSVRTSLRMYVIGKKTTAPPNVKGPILVTLRTSMLVQTATVAAATERIS